MSCLYNHLFLDITEVQTTRQHELQRLHSAVQCRICAVNPTYVKVNVQNLNVCLYFFCLKDYEVKITIWDRPFLFNKLSVSEPWDGLYHNRTDEMLKVLSSCTEEGTSPTVLF